MKQILFVLTVATQVMLLSQVIAQPLPPEVVWTRTYARPGAQNVRDATLTPDGGLIIVGSSDSIGGEFRYPLVLKVNGDGDSLWSRMYVDSIESHVNAITRVATGGYAMAGYVAGTPVLYDDYLLLRIGETGDTEWRERYLNIEPEKAEDVKQCADGGFVLCGEVSEISWWVRVVRTNSAGDTLWTRNYQFGYENAWGYSIDIVPSGGYIIGGRFIWSTHMPPEYDCLAIRIDENGDTLWTAIVGSERQDWGVEVLPTPDGGFILLGYTEGYTQVPGEFIRAAYLVKLNDQGHVLWDRYLPHDAEWQEPYDIALVGNSGYVIAGLERTTSSGETEHPVIIRVDTQGDTLWTLHLRQYVFGVAQMIHVMSDGGYIISGDYAGDFFCARTAPDPVSVRDTPVPAKISLLRAYPNPFNGATQIEFSLPSTQRVSLRLYDVLGREVAVLMNEVRTAGRHEVMFDASTLPSGVYLCWLEAGGMAQTRKIVLVK